MSTYATTNEKKGSGTGGPTDSTSEGSHKDEWPVISHVLTAGLEEAAHSHGFATRDGRYVLDPAEARREFGDDMAATLKLSEDGKYVLWPQPIGENDPQSWSPAKKNLMMWVLALAAIVPDFSSSVGIAALFNLAEEYSTTINEINNVSSNWSIFLLGPGGIAVVLFACRFGRLPAYFWSMFLGLGMMIGCTFAQDFATFTVFRCLNAWFTTSGQVLGLYVINDMYPVHQRAQKVSVWTFAFVFSPFIGPWLLGYLCANVNWRWAYAVGSFYTAAVVLLIAFCMEETLYDRHLDPMPRRPTSGLRYRIETLIGLTGWKLRRHRPTLLSSAIQFVNVVWRPHFILPMLLIMASFGSSIGINVLNSTFMAEFFGMGPIGRSTTYITPIVGSALGEIVARECVKWSTRYSLRRNQGVLEAEDLYLPTLPGAFTFFIGALFYGLGAHLKILALMIIGWGAVVMGVVIILVAIVSYEGLSFPEREGELGALINMVRTLYGFAIPYFQPVWIGEAGPLTPFAVEGAVCMALWIVLIPALYKYGPKLREKFSISHTGL